MSALTRRQALAERARRCRARQRAGRGILKIEVDLSALADALVLAEFLDRLRADDRESIRDAAERLVNFWADEGRM